MGVFVLRRILVSIPVLLGISVIAFAILSLAPGDPITARVDPIVLSQLTPGQIENLRRLYGLDQPIPIRYLIWLGGIVQGDLGFTIVGNRSVGLEIQSRLPQTLLLMGTGLLLGALIGIPLGIVAAVKQGSLVDHVLTAFTMVGIVIPPFVLGLIAIYVFGVYLRLLPTGGMETLGQAPTVVDRIQHLILPASILAVQFAAPLMRYTRASMLEVMGSDYLTTARAKGLAGSTVLVRHAFRNALLPVITIIGLSLPDLIGGAVVTEQVFSWPGMGQLAVRAAAQRDPALMMGFVLVVSIGVLVANLAADLAYGIADPRVRVGKRA